MSEFKFACPVCGQHITADSATAGSRLECPTCFRKIVVPNAPGSTDPKFILSAAQADKPRPTSGTAPLPEPVATLAPSPFIPVTIAALLALACVAATLLFVFRGHLVSKQHPGAGAQIQPAAVTNKVVLPTPTNTLAWTLDLTKAAFPETTASGRLRGRDFVCARATLQNGILTLRQNRSGPIDLGVSIEFFAQQPEELRGLKANITTNNVGAPRVVLRWREADHTATTEFNERYAMKIEFGTLGSTRMTGKIYLCLPDDLKSCVAGTFSAEIRKPSPPKQRPPRPRRTP